MDILLSVGSTFVHFVLLFGTGLLVKLVITTIKDAHNDIHNPQD